MSYPPAAAIKKHFACRGLRHHIPETGPVGCLGESPFAGPAHTTNNGREFRNHGKRGAAKQ
jgi:hypothetical protein